MDEITAYRVIGGFLGTLDDFNITSSLEHEYGYVLTVDVVSYFIRMGVIIEDQ